MAHARRRPLSLLALFLVLACAGLLAPAMPGLPARSEASVAAPGAQELRVMLVGDSLTHGTGGSTTYRYWLWREFEDQGVPVTFVGPRTDLNRGGGEDHYNRLDHGFETNHAAQFGSDFHYHLRRVDELMEEYRPDVVVLQLGFNDAAVHSARRIAHDTTRYLRRVFAHDPATRVVLGEIIPTTDPRISGRRNERTVAANRLVRRRWESDPRVAINELRTARRHAWAPLGHTYDHKHPNATGETLMAHRMAQGLAELGIFTRQVRVYHRTPWRPTVAPEVLVDGRRVTVRTGETMRTISATRSRLRFTPASKTPGGERAAPATLTTRWSAHREVVRRLAPGEYLVRLQVRRRMMTGITEATRVAVA